MKITTIHTTEEEFSSAIDALRAELDVRFVAEFSTFNVAETQAQAQAALWREDYREHTRLDEQLTFWARCSAIRCARSHAIAGNWNLVVQMFLYAKDHEDRTVRDRLIDDAITVTAP